MRLYKRAIASGLAMFALFAFLAMFYAVQFSYADEMETSGTCGENIIWSYDAETATLTLEGEGETFQNYSTSVNPNWGYVMTPWLENGFADQIKTVVVGEGITDLGQYLFANCKSATEFRFPSTLVAIGARIFSGCSAVEVMDLSNTNISSAKIYPFMNCNSLHDIKLPETLKELPNGFYDDCNGLVEYEIPSSVTKIGYRLFWDCKNLKKVTIPSSITDMADGTFWGCEALETAIINANVTIMGSVDEDYTFNNCSSLKNVTLPSSLETLGEAAFINCKSLEEVEIPDSVTYIGKNVFSGCPSLKKVGFGSCKTIGDNAYRGTAITEAILPDTLESIGMLAFNKCESLKNVYVPESVTSMSSKAFTKIAPNSNLIVRNKDLYNEIAEYPQYWLTTSRTSLYNSKVPLTLTVKQNDWVAKSAVPAPSLTGNEGEGEVTYAYYSDAALTKAVDPASLKTGTYYVQASVAETTFYQAGSTSASFTVHPAVGDTISAGSGATKADYKLTSASAVSYVKAGVGSKKAATVPASIKYLGKTYKVTGIAANAFKGSKVATLTVQTKSLTKKSVKGSLKASKVKTVKVPKAKKNAYKKIFTKAVAGKKVTVK